MNLFIAGLLGAVGGLTEFIPISSTAHLLVVGRFLGVLRETFSVGFGSAVQLGAAAAVAVWYRKIIPGNGEMHKRVAVALVPTGIVSALLYPFAKRHLFDNVEVLLWTLVLGGIFMAFLEVIHQAGSKTEEQSHTLSYKTALWIGIAQGFAIIPGISRAAMTILGAMTLKVRREIAVEFSLLLAVPTIAGIALFNLGAVSSEFSLNQTGALAIGFLFSFGAALVAIPALLAFSKRYNFIWFGAYRVAFALFMIVAFLI